MSSNVIADCPWKLDFEVLIDESMVSVMSDASIQPIENKTLLSIINDFEDGAWRYEKFENFIWDNIAQTALSAQERNSLVNKSQTQLKQAAKNLRLTDLEKDDIGKGSELAEIVLYGIMKDHYKALSVVPKIFYKQNSQDNAKGADSVHIILDEEKDFSLWLGEAKFYNDIQNVRLDSIVRSVENSLNLDKLKKENSIVTNLTDLDNEVKNIELRSRIKDALSHSSSIDDLKPKLNIPILLLHECAITKGQCELTAEYKDGITKYHKDRAEAYFKKQIAKCSALHKYSEIKFHLILFPTPCKETIVNKFVSNVQFYKGK